MKIDVTYCSNYNGCQVLVIQGPKTFSEFEPEFKEKIEAVQDKIIEEAYKDVIKRGRHQGEFNGDIDDLEEFAKKVVHEQFGDAVEFVFEEDSSST